MKKILSILAITSVLASTTPMVIACKSKPKSQKSIPWTKVTPAKPTPSKPLKLDLYDLKITGIVPSSNPNHPLTINIKSAYDKIVKTIIQAYNARKYSTTPTLTATNFTYGSTTDDTHSWAIEVLKSDDQTRFNAPTGTSADKQTIIVSDSKNSGVLLDDNGLRVMIRTTNINVTKISSSQAITIKAYLSKFLYSGTNINQGFDIYGNGHPTADQLARSWNISKDFAKINDRTSLEAIKTLVKKFTTTHPVAAATISKNILADLNNRLEKETRTLNHWGVLKIETNALIQFADTDVTIYSVNGTVVRQMSDIPLPDGAIIYARIWNLGWSHYIANAHAYLYLKLGTVQSS